MDHVFPLPPPVLDHPAGVDQDPTGVQEPLDHVPDGLLGHPSGSVQDQEGLQTEGEGVEGGAADAVVCGQAGDVNGGHLAGGKGLVEPGGP